MKQFFLSERLLHSIKHLLSKHSPFLLYTSVLNGKHLPEIRILFSADVLEKYNLRKNFLFKITAKRRFSSFCFFAGRIVACKLQYIDESVLNYHQSKMYDREKTNKGLRQAEKNSCRRKEKMGCSFNSAAVCFRINSFHIV